MTAPPAATKAVVAPKPAWYRGASCFGQRKEPYTWKSGVSVFDGNDCVVQATYGSEVTWKCGKHNQHVSKVTPERDLPKPLIRAMQTARFSLPSKLVTMYDKKIGTAVQIPAPPNAMNAYLCIERMSQRSFPLLP